MVTFDTSAPEKETESGAVRDHAENIETRRRRFLESPWLLVFVLGLGTLVFLPALRATFLLDDYLHRSMVEGTFPVSRGPFDLYNFIDDDNRKLFLERGLVPWWTQPELKIRFFRPLASALLWLDHRVWGDSPLPMHLQSFAWWLFAVLAVRALFARTFSRRVTSIGTAVFALAPSHALPLAWLANREALVSLAFGSLGLITYERFRTKSSARDFTATLFLFAFAFLGGGEYALCFGGYVVAFELVRRNESITRRLTGLLPFVVPVVTYLAVRGALHYGTTASGFYSDPLRDPVAFLRKAPWRAVALLSNGWLSLDAEHFTETWERIAAVVLVLIATVALLRPLKRAIAKLDDRGRVKGAWLVLGSLFSLAPVLAVSPSVRLLGIATVGVAAAVALLLDHVWFSGPSEDRRGRTEIAAMLLGFAHLVHGPVTAFLLSRLHAHDAAEFAKRTRGLRERVGDPTVATIGVVRGMGGTFFAAFALDPRGAPPAGWYVLAHAGHTLVRRIEPRAVELLLPEDKSIFPIGDGDLFRGDTLPLHTGDVLDLPMFRVTILRTGVAGPNRVRFDFKKDPDSIKWISDELDATLDAQLPKVGFGAPFDP